jgi:hypothetical protein
MRMSHITIKPSAGKNPNTQKEGTMRLTGQLAKQKNETTDQYVVRLEKLYDELDEKHTRKGDKSGITAMQLLNFSEQINRIKMIEQNKKQPRGHAKTTRTHDGEYMSFFPPKQHRPQPPPPPSHNRQQQQPPPHNQQQQQQQRAPTEISSSASAEARALRIENERLRAQVEELQRRLGIAPAPADASKTYTGYKGKGVPTDDIDGRRYGKNDTLMVVCPTEPALPVTNEVFAQEIAKYCGFGPVYITRVPYMPRNGQSHDARGAPRKQTAIRFVKFADAAQAEICITRMGGIDVQGHTLILSYANKDAAHKIRENPPDSAIFVEDLPHTTTTRDLYTMFRKEGSVYYTRLLGKPNKPKKAIVLFMGLTAVLDAKRAIEKQRTDFSVTPLKKQPKKSQPQSIFAKQLRPHMPQDELIQLFKHYGDIDSAYIKTAANNKHAFAYINYKNTSEATTAVQSINNAIALHFNKVPCDTCTPQETLKKINDAAKGVLAEATITHITATKAQPQKAISGTALFKKQTTYQTALIALTAIRDAFNDHGDTDDDEDDNDDDEDAEDDEDRARGSSFMFEVSTIVAEPAKTKAEIAREQSEQKRINLQEAQTHANFYIAPIRSGTDEHDITQAFTAIGVELTKLTLIATRKGHKAALARAQDKALESSLNEIVINGYIATVAPLQSKNTRKTQRNLQKTQAAAAATQQHDNTHQQPLIAAGPPIINNTQPVHTQPHHANFFARPPIQQNMFFARPQPQNNMSFARPQLQNNMSFARPQNQQNTALMRPPIRQNIPFMRPQNQQNMVFARPQNQQNMVFARPQNQQNMVFARPQNQQNMVFARPQNQQNTALMRPPIRQNTPFMRPPIRQNIPFMRPPIRQNNTGPMRPPIRQNNTGPMRPPIRQNNTGPMRPPIRKNIPFMRPQNQQNMSFARPQNQNNTGTMRPPIRQNTPFVRQPIRQNTPFMRTQNQHNRPFFAPSHTTPWKSNTVTGLRLPQNTKMFAATQRPPRSQNTKMFAATQRPPNAQNTKMFAATQRPPNAQNTKMWSNKPKKGIQIEPKK